MPKPFEFARRRWRFPCIRKGPRVKFDDWCAGRLSRFNLRSIRSNEKGYLDIFGSQSPNRLGDAGELPGHFKSAFRRYFFP